MPGPRCSATGHGGGSDEGRFTGPPHGDTTSVTAPPPRRATVPEEGSPNRGNKKECHSLVVLDVYALRRLSPPSSRRIHGRVSHPGGWHGCSDVALAGGGSALQGNSRVFVSCPPAFHIVSRDTHRRVPSRFVGFTLFYQAYGPLCYPRVFSRFPGVASSWSSPYSTYGALIWPPRTTPATIHNYHPDPTALETYIANRKKSIDKSCSYR